MKGKKEEGRAKLAATYAPRDAGRGEDGELKRNAAAWLKQPAEETTRGRRTSLGNCTLAAAAKAPRTRGEILRQRMGR